MLGLPLHRGGAGFIHKYGPELLYVFLVFPGVPGLHHALVGVCFNLRPGFSFKIDMLCDFNALDSLENARHQRSYIKTQEL